MFLLHVNQRCGIKKDVENLVVLGMIKRAILKLMVWRIINNNNNRLLTDLSKCKLVHSV